MWATVYTLGLCLNFNSGELVSHKESTLKKLKQKKILKKKYVYCTINNIL